MTNNEAEELRIKIDQLIVRYKMSEACHLLRKIPVENVPAKLRSQFAQLARRAGLLQRSLKFIHSVVFESKNSTLNDKIEYASTIRRLGMTNQSRKILNQLPEGPEKNLYLAFNAIQEWDYEPALEYLKLYIKNPGLTAKQHLVGNLNIAACNIQIGNFEQAHSLLLSIQSEFENSVEHLQLNWLELMGQVSLKLDQPKDAINYLETAMKMNGNQQTSATLWIDKWTLLARIKLHEINSNSECVLELKKKLRIQGQWETLRDFDFQLSTILQDHDLGLKVYFGTPFTPVKKKIKSIKLKKFKINIMKK